MVAHEQYNKIRHVRGIDPSGQIRRTPFSKASEGPFSAAASAFRALNQFSRFGWKAGFDGSAGKGFEG